MTPPRSRLDDLDDGRPPPPDWAERYWSTDSDVERWELVRGWLTWCEAELDRSAVELGEVRRERDEYRDAFSHTYTELLTERSRDGWR